MAVRKIKNSKSEGEKLEEDFNVRTVVEKTLKEVEVKGDEAVRELSKKFDNSSSNWRTARLVPDIFFLFKFFNTSNLSLVKM